MSGRSSTPEDEPPRRHGGRGAWLVGTIPGVIALAFIAIVVIVLVVLLLS